MIQTRIAMLALVLAGVMGAQVQATAQAPRVHFVEDEAEFVDGLATVHVSNPTPDPVTVGFRLIWTDLTSPDGRPVDASTAFTLTSTTVVPPGDRRSVFVFRVDDVALAEDGGDPFNGTLRLESNNASDSVELSLTPTSEDSPATPVSAVDEWDVVQERPWPWGDYTTVGEDVPLEGKAEAATDVIEMYLTGPGPSTLFATGDIVVKNDVQVLSLSFDEGSDGSPTGDYEGTFDLQPEVEDEGDVEVTLKRRDRVLAPTLLLVLGLFIAWWGQRWLSPSGRTLSHLHTKSREAADKLRQNSKIRELRLEGLDAFLDKIGSARKRLWRRPAPVAADNAEIRTEISNVDLLTQASEVWSDSQIGASIDSLKSSLDGLQVPTTLPGALVDAPAFIAEARDLLSGEVPVEEVVERKAKMDAAAEAATVWPELFDLIGRYSERLAELDLQRERMPTADKRLLERGHRLASGIRWDLWHAKDGTDLKARTASEELLEAEEIVGQLSYYLPPSEETLPPEDALHLTAAPSLRPLVDFADRLPSFAEIATWLRSPAAEKVRDRALDSAFVLLAFAVSVWAGLVALYFDKTFGTWRDYLGLLAWAVGTAAVLDVINGVLSKLGPPETTKTDEAEPAAIA